MIHIAQIGSLTGYSADLSHTFTVSAGSWSSLFRQDGCLFLSDRSLQRNIRYSLLLESTPASVSEVRKKSVTMSASLLAACHRYEELEAESITAKRCSCIRKTSDGI